MVILERWLGDTYVKVSCYAPACRCAGQLHERCCNPVGGGGGGLFRYSKTYVESLKMGFVAKSSDHVVFSCAGSTLSRGYLSVLPTSVTGLRSRFKQALSSDVAITLCRKDKQERHACTCWVYVLFVLPEVSLERPVVLWMHGGFLPFF